MCAAEMLLERERKLWQELNLNVVIMTESRHCANAELYVTHGSMVLNLRNQNLCITFPRQRSIVPVLCALQKPVVMVIQLQTAENSTPRTTGSTVFEEGITHGCINKPRVSCVLKYGACISGGFFR